MQMLYLMILMIDPCNYYADISEIAATAVSFCVSSSVPYSIFKGFFIPYTTLTYFQNIFMQMLLQLF
jgi:hypothetical protein